MIRAFRRFLTRFFFLLLCLSGTAAAQQSDAFPRPAALEPAIQFWIKVYTEIDTEHGFLHDAVNLSVIYETVHYERTGVERERARIQEALRALATGKRSGLNHLEQSVLDKWPADVSNATLAAAANNVRFQLGQSDRFVAGLIRSGAYRSHIDSVIRAKGLPIELGALPHVESSFHPGAYSSVAAAGMWQFMRATGQRYMRIDHIVDERLDPYTATHAAMSLLEFNYSILGNWPLALTAYNHGVGGMGRAVRETGSDRIEDIVFNYKGPAFGFASRNFYAQFLAVLDVEKRAQALFGVLQLDPSPEYEEFEMDSYVEARTLAETLGVTLEQLQFDNPALRPVVWEGDKRIPKGYVVKVQRKSLNAPLATLMASIPASERFPIQTPDVEYFVQSGDSLSAIARRFRTSVAQLVALNQLADRNTLSIGQRLILPQDSAAATGQSSAQIAAAAPASSAPRASGGAGSRPDAYAVRRGDTLSTIARRYGVSEAALLRVNDLDDPHRIFPGQMLRFPTDDSPVVQVAAATPAPVSQPAEAPVAAAPAPSAIVEAPPTPEYTPVVAGAEVDNVAVVFDPSAPAVAGSGTTVQDLSADPSDYSVSADGSIEIQASETLGHYADWVGMSVAAVRRLNGMSASQPVVIGRRLKLDFSRVSVAQFESRRRDFHLAEQQKFFAEYRIQDVAHHTVAANDNIAALARSKYAVPMWLLRQYNPGLDFRSVQIGQTVMFPVLEAVEASGSSG